MTTVIMLFILPLGIIFYFFDKKTKKQNKKILDEHVHKIQTSELTQKEKLNIIDEMYYQNGFKIVQKTDDLLVVQKKHFNLGVLFIFFGLLSYFGLPLYYIYYRFILKPDEVRISFSD
jgi:hypothetical protein